MATKEEEKKALEKIKKIVSDLGNESYLSFAFDGCFELAEENINNDFATSYKARYDGAKQEIENLRIKVLALEANSKADKETIERLSKRKEELNKQIIDEQNNTYKVTNWYSEANKSIEEKDAKIQAQDYEILTLKARLYDYMAQ